MYQLLFYAFCAGVLFGVILGSLSLTLLRAWHEKIEHEGE